MAKELTTKEKCERVARALESVANKLNDAEIGVKLWESEEPAIQTLISQLGILLNKASELKNGELPRSVRGGRRSKPKKVETEEWPDIISD